GRRPPRRPPFPYTTLFRSKWGLGEADQPGRPLVQGFDYSFGYLNQSHAHNYYPEYLYRNGKQVALRNEVQPLGRAPGAGVATRRDRKSTRLNSSHVKSSYA